MSDEKYFKMLLVVTGLIFVGFMISDDTDAARIIGEGDLGKIAMLILGVGFLSLMCGFAVAGLIQTVVSSVRERR